MKETVRPSFASIFRLKSLPPVWSSPWGSTGLISDRDDERSKSASFHSLTSGVAMTSGPYMMAPTHLGSNGVRTSFLPVAARSILSGPQEMWVV